MIPPIPGYEPIRVLGINFCTVYLARHSSSGALVALKVWGLESAGHVREQSLARLDHPNIIRGVGMGESEGGFFCALEYCERTLADRLLKGPMSDVEAARLAYAVSSALQYAHDQGMTLLNLTPKSILLTEQDVPKLLDFCPTEAFGKPPHVPSSASMTPEWISGVDEAGQVFRMGALLYELLTAQASVRGTPDVEGSGQ